MKKPSINSSTARSNRRNGADRRLVEKGPPGRRERRVHVEPRQPEVQHVEFTSSEWDTLTGVPLPPEPTS